MLNIRQFSQLLAYSVATDMLRPTFQGPKWSWEETFPEMALSKIKTEWFLASRSDKVIERAIATGEVQREIVYVQEKILTVLKELKKAQDKV